VRWAGEEVFIFNPFKKKKSQMNIGDVLFGDLPISQWPKEEKIIDDEP
jgi:hypothetical protein